MNNWLLLFFTILLEVFGTSCLKASIGLTKLWPTLGTFVGYGFSFYLLSLVLKTMPIGIAYAIWSGVGIVLTAFIGRVIFKQHLGLGALLGIGLILAGVIVLNLFSKNLH